MKLARFIPPALLGATSALGVALCATAPACTASQAKSAETVLIDLADAACDVVATDVDSATVDFVCTLVTDVTGAAKTFTVRVAKPNAQAFLAAHGPAAHATDAGHE